MPYEVGPDAEPKEPKRDHTFHCASCPHTFVWTVGEQMFIDQLVFEGKLARKHPPKRCPDCRAVRKVGRLGRPTWWGQRKPN